MKPLLKQSFQKKDDIFLYVVNTLKINFREFPYVAIRIQNHKRAFEYFYEKSFEHVDNINELKQVPAIWNEKILIVEDDELIADLLKAIPMMKGILILSAMV